MYNDLARIERCYGSVAEYNRSREESEEREYELEEKRRKYYAESKMREKEASKNGFLFTYYGEGYCESCRKCEHLHEVGMRDDCDDVGLMYCDNNACTHNIECRLERLMYEKKMDRKRKEFSSEHPEDFESGNYWWSDSEDCFVVRRDY